MELNKIDEQIKALQKKKKEQIKKTEEKVKSEFLKKVIGKDFETIHKILKSRFILLSFTLIVSATELSF